MRKNITAVLAALLLAAPASAGNLTYEAPVEAEVVVLDEAPAGSMGGSGAWLIPLLAIGLVALAVSQSNDDSTDSEDPDDGDDGADPGDDCEDPVS